MSLALLFVLTCTYVACVSDSHSSNSSNVARLECLAVRQILVEETLGVPGNTGSIRGKDVH